MLNTFMFLSQTLLQKDWQRQIEIQVTKVKGPTCTISGVWFSCREESQRNRSTLWLSWGQRALCMRCNLHCRALCPAASLWREDRFL